MEYKIRPILKEEYSILEAFLYEAIFVPQGTPAPPIEKQLNQASFSFAYRHIAFMYLSHAMMTDFSPMYKIIFRKNVQQSVNN